MRVKKSKYSAGLKNNHGQAVIEYVLMLIITVSLILMLVTQIFKPLQAFTQSFMGDYMACLLETGELPVLGQDNTDSECKVSFQNVAGSNSSSSSSNSSSSNNSSSSSSNSSSSKSSSSSDSASSSGNSTYAGSNSRRSGSSYVAGGRAPTKGIDSGSESGGKVVEIALEGGGAGGFYRASNGATYAEVGRRVASVPVTGLTAEERKKLEKKAAGDNKVTSVQNDGTTQPVKKIAVKKPEVQTLTQEEDKPVTFGNFIRWLFIAALIIALVIFLGGQALQFSKSAEK
ncbi:hypothetical protein [Bdellovibrio sp. HCB209]|uniref:hypothetical protein n=1 Tax=Bdellovibrio sp. HCB209 TaxID=3394354 RepID=UPI0039B55DA5